MLDWFFLVFGKKLLVVSQGLDTLKEVLFYLIFK